MARKRGTRITGLVPKIAGTLGGGIRALARRPQSLLLLTALAIAG